MPTIENLTAEQSARLFALHAECEDAWSQWKKTQEAVKGSKSAWEAANLALTSFIRRCRNGQGEQLPLFLNPPADDAAPVAPVGPPEGDDSWRSVPISELGLTEKVRDYLEHAEPPLFNIGQIADFTANDRRFTDIKGIGPSAADKIEAALTAFWKRRADQALASDGNPIDPSFDHEPPAEPSEPSEDDPGGEG